MSRHLLSFWKCESYVQSPSSCVRQHLGWLKRYSNPCCVARWLADNLAATSTDRSGILTVALAPGLLVLLTNSRRLNTLAIGDESATRISWLEQSRQRGSTGRGHPGPPQTISAAEVSAGFPEEGLDDVRWESPPLVLTRGSPGSLPWCVDCVELSSTITALTGATSPYGVLETGQSRNVSLSKTHCEAMLS